jgi:hypothetical protein
MTFILFVDNTNAARYIWNIHPMRNVPLMTIDELEIRIMGAASALARAKRRLDTPYRASRFASGTA